MIKKLQKNFIRIAALALLSVILIVVASINGVFLYQCNQLLDNKLENMLIRHTGKQDDARDKPQKEKAPGAEEPGKKRTTSPFDIFPLLHQNMQSSSACCVVILDSDYTIQIVRQNIEDSFSDEDLESYIAVIRQEEKDHGWYQFIKYRVIVNKDADGNEQICIAFINASPTLYSILSLLVISLISGLVLPPHIAPVQAMVIPIQQKKEGVLDKAAEVKEALGKSGIRARMDDSDKSPGWKFSESEMRGIPVRIELGPKDIEAGQAVIVRRDTREKIAVSLEELNSKVTEVLETMQKDMLERARAHRESHTYTAKTLEEFKDIAENKPGFIKAMWCGDQACEDALKEEAGVTSRCIPFKQEEITCECIYCKKPAKAMVYWGKAY